MKQCVLTTIDNVWNPFTHFDEWYAFDLEHHYNTMEWLARFSKASPELEVDEYCDETSYAIDRFLELNPFGLHIKVYKDEADTLIPLANKAYKESFEKGSKA